MLGIWYRGWGFSFCSLKYCCSSCFFSFAKRAISTHVVGVCCHGYEGYAEDFV